MSIALGGLSRAPGKTSRYAHTTTGSIPVAANESGRYAFQRGTVRLARCSMMTPMRIGFAPAPLLSAGPCGQARPRSWPASWVAPPAIRRSSPLVSAPTVQLNCIVPRPCSNSAWRDSMTTLRDQRYSLRHPPPFRAPRIGRLRRRIYAFVPAWLSEAGSCSVSLHRRCVDSGHGRRQRRTRMGPSSIAPPSTTTAVPVT